MFAWHVSPEEFTWPDNYISISQLALAVKRRSGKSVPHYLSKRSSLSTFVDINRGFSFFSFQRQCRQRKLTALSRNRTELLLRTVVGCQLAYFSLSILKPQATCWQERGGTTWTRCYFVPRLIFQDLESTSLWVGASTNLRFAVPCDFGTHGDLVV